MVQQTTSSTLPHQPIPISWVEGLFKRMSFAYGAQFADKWAGIDGRELKAYWADRLGVLSDKELLTGYRMLESRDRPPSLPEFLKLCRPNLDPERAFYEALEQGRKREQGDPDDPDVWSHPAIYWAWVSVGAFSITSQGYEVLRTRWSDELRNLVDSPSLSPVPQKLVELSAPGKTRMHPERAKKLLATLQVRPIPPAGTPRKLGWAHAVVAKNDRGEVVSIAALEMAQQALGLR